MLKFIEIFCEFQSTIKSACPANLLLIWFLFGLNKSKKLDKSE